MVCAVGGFPGTAGTCGGPSSGPKCTGDSLGPSKAQEVGISLRPALQRKTRRPAGVKGLSGHVGVQAASPSPAHSVAGGEDSGGEGPGADGLHCLPLRLQLLSGCE